MNLTLLLVHFGYLGTGFLVIRFICDPAPFPLLRRLLIAYVVGLVCQISILYAIAAVSPVRHGLAHLLTLGGVLLWIVFSGIAFKGWWLERTPKGQKPRQWRTCLPSLSVIPKLVLFLLLLLPTIPTLMFAKAVPIFGWDGIAIWSTKAQALFVGEHLHSDFFVNPDRVHPHPGYPIGLPLYEFQHEAVEGQIHEILITRALLTVLLLWLLAFFDIVSEFSGRTTGIATVVILMYTPVFFNPRALASPLSGFADFPTGALIALAVGWFNSWLIKRDFLNLVGSSAAVVAIIGLKNEGMVWAALIVAIGMFSVIVIRPQIRKKEIVAMAIPTIAMITLKIIHSHLPTSSDIHVPSWSEIKQIVDVIPKMAAIGDLSWWRPTHILGILPIMVIVGYVMGFPRQWKNKNSMLALIGPAMWFVIFIVMALTETQLGNFEYYSKVTFPRLLLQATPVSLYWAIVLNSPTFPHSGRYFSPGTQSI